MKGNRIILDTHKLLGFRLVDKEQLLGVASGVKLSVKVGSKDNIRYAKIGGKTDINNFKIKTLLKVRSAHLYAVYGNVYFSVVNETDTTPLPFVCISPELGNFPPMQ